MYHFGDLLSKDTYWPGENEEEAGVHDAWCFLQGFAVEAEEMACEGLTEISGIEFEDQLIDLPETLQRLTFRSNYNQDFPVS